MDGWVSEEGLRWRALAPFGVEIDCDLSAPHTPARTARLAALLADHGYVLARGHLGQSHPAARPRFARRRRATSAAAGGGGRSR